MFRNFGVEVDRMQYIQQFWGLQYSIRAEPFIFGSYREPLFLAHAETFYL